MNRSGAMIRIVAILGLVLSLALAPSQPANADSTKPTIIWSNPNPGTAVPTDLAFIYTSTSSSAATRLAGVASTSSCGDQTASIWGVDGNGNTVWRLDDRVQWCYDGSQITYYFRYPSISVCCAWYDRGTVSDSNSTPTTGVWQVDSYHQHHFNHCIDYPWGQYCANDVYPWVQLLVNGAGGYSSSAGT